MWKLINFVGFFLFAAGAWAQVTVAAQLDSSKIIIGDQVRLNLIVNHSPDIKITGADFSALEKVEKVEVLNISPWDTVSKGAEYIIEQDITLTSFDSGYYWLPKIPIKYISSNGKGGQAMTRELPLTVNTIQIGSDSTNLAPIKPIIEEPLSIRDALPYLAALLIIVLLGLIIYFVYKRRQQKELEPEPEIILPAHEIAFAKLEELKKAKLWQQGQIKEYQSQLTYIVREYLENRFDIHALESTTYEIMQQIKRQDFAQEWQPALKKMLETADLVKFAKAEPPVDIHAKMLEEAESFVRQTKKIEIIQEEVTTVEEAEGEATDSEIENEKN